MDLFKRKSKPLTDLECKICHMKFSDPDRTTRHMIKAHSKPQKNNRQIGVQNIVNYFTKIYKLRKNYFVRND